MRDYGLEHLPTRPEKISFQRTQPISQDLLTSSSRSSTSGREGCVHSQITFEAGKPLRTRTEPGAHVGNATPELPVPWAGRRPSAIHSQQFLHWDTRQATATKSSSSDIHYPGSMDLDDRHFSTFVHDQTLHSLARIERPVPAAVVHTARAGARWSRRDNHLENQELILPASCPVCPRPLRPEPLAASGGPGGIVTRNLLSARRRHRDPFPPSARLPQVPPARSDGGHAR